MIVFSTSDKGGTGRSVTSCNVAFRMSASGTDVAYVDFDFGSPTAGALFEISAAERGVAGHKGLHTYLIDGLSMATRCDVRETTDRPALRKSRSRPGNLVLFPGDDGGAEFTSIDETVVQRCATLLAEIQDEFEVCIVDLSAGRSLSMELVLRATATPQLSSVPVRWLVFHRWTRQHIIAASGLVHGRHGLLEGAEQWGHDATKLLRTLRYVRTAVPQLNEPGGRAASGAQAAWLLEQNSALRSLASRKRLGRSSLLGSTPVEPMLQWREQIILDSDVVNNVANPATVAAFTDLMNGLMDRGSWE